MKIDILMPHEKVVTPGAYRMTMDQYHATDLCDGVSVSSSHLRTVVTKSPHAFWKTWGGNPNRYPPKEPSDSLVLGRAAHCLILGDEVFDHAFVLLPEDAPRKPTAPQVAAYARTGFWSDVARECGMWWREFTDLVGNRSVVTQEQMQRISYMAENLAASPEAVTALTSALTEISLIWQDEATGLWVKSRPDCIPDNGYDFGDLKTFAPKGGDLTIAAQRSVTEFGYAQQMALAMEGAERVLGQSGDNCMLVFVMTSEPYEVVPILLEPEALYWARVLNRKALDQIAHGILTGVWPMRVTHPVRYEYPPSMLHQFGEAQARGDLPSMERWT